MWKPEYKIKDILVSIFSLFYMNKIDSPCSMDMANELKNNKALYKEKIRYFTKKYANPMSNQGIKTIWNFSYQYWFILNIYIIYIKYINIILY